MVASQIDVFLSFAFKCLGNRKRLGEEAPTFQPSDLLPQLVGAQRNADHASSRFAARQKFASAQPSPCAYSMHDGPHLRIFLALPALTLEFFVLVNFPAQSALESK